MFEVIQQNSATASRRRLYGKIIDATDAVSGKNIAVAGVKAMLTKGDGTAFTSTADIVLSNPANTPGRFYVELTQAECDTLGVIDGEVPASAGNYLAATLHGEIVAYDPDADGASVTDIAAGVRTELTTELARIDVASSSRLAAVSYTAPDNSGIAAIQAKTDNLPPDPADQSLIIAATDALSAAIAALNDLDAAGVRAAVGLAVANLDAQIGAIPTAVENADALLARNQKGGADGPPEESVSAALAGGFLLFSGGDTGTLVVNNGDGTPAYSRTLTRDLTKLLGAIISAVSA